MKTYRIVRLPHYLHYHTDNSQDASSAEPKYTPVQLYIDQNTVPPVEGQEGRFKVGPLDNLDTPEVCFGLVRAVEWINHTLPNDEIAVCMPRSVMRYQGYGDDKAKHQKNIASMAENIFYRTVDRGICLGASIAFRYLRQDEFRSALRYGTSREELEYIITKLEPEHILYVFRDGFKSISFEFLYHDGIRADHVEDELRLELKMFATLATAMFVHDTIHLCLRIRSDEAALTHDMKVGRSAVAQNYIKTPTWGPLKKVGKDLGQLPAATKFETRTGASTGTKVNPPMAAEGEWED
jgi:hypothetical protein